MHASRAAVTQVLAHGNDGVETHMRLVAQQKKKECKIQKYLAKRPKPENFPSPLSEYVKIGDTVVGWFK